MLIFDVSFETIKGMRSDHIQYYYLEKPNSIELYKPAGDGIILRYTYYKQNNEQDQVWFTTFMTMATRTTNMEVKSLDTIEVKSINKQAETLNKLGKIMFDLKTEITNLNDGLRDVKEKLDK